MYTSGHVKKNPETDTIRHAAIAILIFLLPTLRSHAQGYRFTQPVIFTLQDSTYTIIRLSPDSNASPAMNASAIYLASQAKEFILDRFRREFKNDPVVLNYINTKLVDQLSDQNLLDGHSFLNIIFKSDAQSPVGEWGKPVATLKTTYPDQDGKLPFETSEKLDIGAILKMSLRREDSYGRTFAPIEMKHLVVVPDQIDLAAAIWEQSFSSMAMTAGERVLHPSLVLLHCPDRMSDYYARYGFQIIDHAPAVGKIMSMDAVVAQIEGQSTLSARTQNSKRISLQEAYTRGAVSVSIRWQHWDKQIQTLLANGSDISGAIMQARKILLEEYWSCEELRQFYQSSPGN